MDKQQEATAPPNYGDQPPPYPGTDPNAKQFAGGFSQPPPGQLPGAAYPTQAPGLYPTVPPPQGPAQPPPQQVVIVQGPINYGKNPMTMTCPHCQSSIQTAIKSEPGVLAWIIGGVLCFVGLWCCACIPCCIDDLNTVEHKCPNCNAFLGRYKGGM